jgi:hypothetical protein
MIEGKGTGHDGSEKDNGAYDVFDERKKTKMSKNVMRK